MAFWHQHLRIAQGGGLLQVRSESPAQPAQDEQRKGTDARSDGHARNLRPERRRVGDSDRLDPGLRKTASQRGRQARRKNGALSAGAREVKTEPNKHRWFEGTILPHDEAKTIAN